MEAFILRKRRKHGAEPTQAQDLPPHEDEDDTDMKLVTLASLYDSLDQHILLEALVKANGSVEAACSSLEIFSEPRRKSSQKVIGYQSSLSSMFKLPEKTSPRELKPLTKRGQTLHLYSPEDVAAHTPCSIVHNCLHSEEANALVRELLAEAPTFERQTFKVFDNVVQSPHSACFYVESLEEKRKQQTEYLYNGSYLTVSSY